MTVNKKQWDALAEKYPDKASWVRGLNDLSWGEHDELFSALVELSPEDVSGSDTDITYVTINRDSIDSKAIVSAIKRYGMSTKDSHGIQRYL